MLVRVGCWLLVRVLVVGWLGLVVGSCWLLVRVLVVGWVGLVVGSCWLLVYCLMLKSSVHKSYRPACQSWYKTVVPDYQK